MERNRCFSMMIWVGLCVARMALQKDIACWERLGESRRDLRSGDLAGSGSPDGAFVVVRKSMRCQTLSTGGKNVGVSSKVEGVHFLLLRFPSDVGGIENPAKARFLIPMSMLIRLAVCGDFASPNGDGLVIALVILLRSVCLLPETAAPTAPATYCN